MTQPFVAVSVLHAHHPMLRAQVRTCGTLFRYETHVENNNQINPGVGLRVSCLCPQGHGINARRWNGWLEPFMGRYDLVVLDPDTLSPATLAPTASTAPEQPEASLAA